LQNFKAHLVNLGFAVPPETISVKISPGTTIGHQGVALWDATTHSILVANAFASDEVSVLRQFAHNLLATHEFPSWDYYAIESGLASYFPCSFTNHPMVGDKASDAGRAILPPQDLRKQRKFAEVRISEWYSVQNDGSEVWDGAFLQIRELLGPGAADKLIANTWRALRPVRRPAYTSFGISLIANSRSVENGKYTESIREILKVRGLRL
jgi:hypothetical protein